MPSVDLRVPGVRPTHHRRVEEGRSKERTDSETTLTGRDLKEGPRHTEVGGAIGRLPHPEGGTETLGGRGSSTVSPSRGNSLESGQIREPVFFFFFRCRNSTDLLLLVFRGTVSSCFPVREVSSSGVLVPRPGFGVGTLGRRPVMSPGGPPGVLYRS